MDFWKFEALIRSSSLYFRRADLLMEFDAREGSLTTMMQKFFREELFSTRFVKELKAKGVVTFGEKTQVQGRPTLKVRDELRRRAYLHYHYLLSRTYVNCWQMAEHENSLMWSNYVKTPPGLTIRTSYDRLSRALTNAGREVFGIPIDYVDHDTVPLSWDRQTGGMSQIVMDMLTKKMKPYQDERELRLVTDILSTHEKWAPNLVGSHIDTSLENSLNAQTVAVDLDALIEEIVLHPRCSEEFAANVTTVIQQNVGRLSGRVKRSRIV